jgi:low affinity Fe/Cu permease
MNENSDRRGAPESFRERIENALGRFAAKVASWTGGSWAFALALSTIVVWIITGPIFHYSDTWQLVINTGTTIVTFLMVFLLQRSQNKESLAIQLKLNEIVAAMEGASNRLIDVEDLTESELQVLHRHFGHLAEMAKKDASITQSHSVEEAEMRHEFKRERHRSSRKNAAGSN